MKNFYFDKFPRNVFRIIKKKTALIMTDGFLSLSAVIYLSTSWLQETARSVPMCSAPLGS